MTFSKYQPIFSIDTATTSEMSQESTTVYAQGGKGNNRLIAWEGEKTMTFKVTDALISPMGLAVLSGAGLFDASATKIVHNHVTLTKNIEANGGNPKVTVNYADLAEELGINDGSAIYICTGFGTTGLAYGTLVDSTGYGYAWLNKPLAISGGDTLAQGDPENTVKLTTGKSASFSFDDDDKGTSSGTLKIDFYVAMKSGASQIVIEPDSFGGYFYVEADTLFRREDNGQDMAATLTFPRVKVQSAFTFTMAASGDPSTFDFTMDAFPAATQFDSTKKVCVVMDMIGSDKATTAAATTVHSSATHTAKSGS